MVVLVEVSSMLLELTRLILHQLDKKYDSPLTWYLSSSLMDGGAEVAQK